MVNINLNFKLGIVSFQELMDTKTGKKDLLLVLRRIYKDETQSPEAYVIRLAGKSKQNFLDFIGLKTVEEECLPLLPIELKNQYKELRQTQEILKADLAFNAAARLVRLLHVRYTQFLEDLETAGHNGKINMNNVPISSTFEHSPLMIPSKTLGKVYVFPNLVLDKVNISDLRNICWVVCFDSLKTFNEVRLNKQNSWQPFSRAWQKIKRYEEEVVELEFQNNKNRIVRQVLRIELAKLKRRQKELQSN